MFASSGAKIFRKMENYNFPRVFSFFYHLFFHFLSFFIIVLSCFIIFASSGAKKIQKMKNCNFPRVFSRFYHFFIFLSFFIIFASSGAKIFPKMENCNFPRVFFIVSSFFLSFFDHFSSFLLPVMQKKSKNWKLRFSSSFCFSCFYHFFPHAYLFFNIFHHFCTTEAKMLKNIKNIKKWKKTEKTRKIAIFHFWDFFCTTGSKNDEKWLKHEKTWENCNFPFFEKFLHHWKQKWWNIKKKI